MRMYLFRGYFNFPEIHSQSSGLFRSLAGTASLCLSIVVSTTQGSIAISFLTHQEQSQARGMKKHD